MVIDNAETKSNSSDEPGSSVPGQQSDPHTSTSDAEMNTSSGATSAVNDSLKASSSGAKREGDSVHVLLNLPQAELRLLCSLLAREGYKKVVLELLHFFECSSSY